MSHHSSSLHRGGWTSPSRAGPERVHRRDVAPGEGLVEVPVGAEDAELVLAHAPRLRRAGALAIRERAQRAEEGGVQPPARKQQLVKRRIDVGKRDLDLGAAIERELR